MNIGAVDIGTNTVRLLVTDGERDLERTAVVTRLGQGRDRHGPLHPEGVARTLDELRRLRGLLDQHGTERVRAVATSATRDATDGATFLDAAAEALGARPELLSGDEEGRLAFRGATSGLDPARGPFLVLDIGGGSTELVLGSADVEGVVSMDVGSVRLTQQHLLHDPPQPEELTNAIGLVSDHVDDVRRELPGVEFAATIVGVAGTITTVAAIELGLQHYDRNRIHHFELTRAAAEDVFRTMATEPLADRVHNPGLPRDRADVIVGGCCVLVAVMRSLKARSILVSERDLLDGIADSLR